MIAADPVQLFTSAYSGAEQSGGMYDFRVKMNIMEDLDAAGIHPSTALTGAHRTAVAIIRREFPRGGAVLDIGCGTGHFLRTMRDLGFRVFGVDVARQVIERLRHEGLDVRLGPIDAVPGDWIDPQVCASFFTLHHIVDPLGFVRSVRAKFPNAILILAEYNNLDGHSRYVDLERGLPPRAYSWWGRAQVRLALERAGYRVTTVAVPPRPRDGGFPVAMTIYAALRRRWPGLARSMLVTYYRTLPLLGWPKALWMRLSGRSKYVLAVGYPDGGDPPRQPPGVRLGGAS